MTDNEFCNELHKRAEEYFLKCQKEYAIKELEKLETEIKEDFYNYGYYDWNTAKAIVDIIKEHISELKE